LRLDVTNVDREESQFVHVCALRPFCCTCKLRLFLS
jgi:hypothetical protein